MRRGDECPMRVLTAVFGAAVALGALETCVGFWARQCSACIRTVPPLTWCSMYGMSRFSGLHIHHCAPGHSVTSRCRTTAPFITRGPGKTLVSPLRGEKRDNQADKHLIITIGPQCSGKTTYLRRVVQNTAPGTVVDVCIDNHPAVSTLTASLVTICPVHKARSVLNPRPFVSASGARW